MCFPDLPHMGHVRTNEAERAKMAVSHFQGRGLKHFAVLCPAEQRIFQRVRKSLRCRVERTEPRMPRLQARVSCNAAHWAR